MRVSSSLSLVLLSSAGLVAFCKPAAAAITLPRIFGDHMVVQAEQPLPVWGQAEPGETVVVKLAGKSATAKADKSGRFSVKLPALPVSFEAATLAVSAPSGEASVTDVLVGEVWLASGQSNMEWPLVRSEGGEQAATSAADPHLRLFRVLHAGSLPEKTIDVEGSWAPAGPQSSAEFSAVGFYFGQRLRQSLKRPVGLIHTAWGGTPIEAWTSQQGLMATREGKLIIKQAFGGSRPRTPAEHAAALDAYKAALAKWESENTQRDSGNEGEAQGFAKSGLPEDGWQKLTVPGHWEDQGTDADGVMWFRKDFKVPAAWVGQDLELHLGVVNDCDTTYVNGTKIGQSCHDTPETHGKPRTLTIPGKLVQPGRLLVAVRVFDERGRGGFSSPPGAVYVKAAGGGDVLSLAGTWNARAEKLLPTLAVQWDAQPRPPLGYPHPMGPTGLWDALVAPMVPYAIKGVLWYQGEANAGRAYQYRRLFPAMIADWRKQWGQGAFPFYFVQLAGFRAPGDPNEWPELREAQALALKVPNTGMAVAIDIGDPNDIHPTNKRDVGERLARWALARTYGLELAHSGPLYKNSKVSGNRITVAFDHADGLRAAGDAGKPQGFAIAGADQKFHAAEAVIDGETVVVSSPEVGKPVAVRYGWEGAPPANLQNASGLPASPFRTDTWPEATRGRH